MNMGTSVAAPNAASSSTAMYSSMPLRMRLPWSVRATETRCQAGGATNGWVRLPAKRSPEGLGHRKLPRTVDQGSRSRHRALNGLCRHLLKEKSRSPEQRGQADQPSNGQALHAAAPPPKQLFGGGAPRDVLLIPIKAVRWY